MVFWFPLDTSKSYIKRVIGLPGDVVEIKDGAVTVNHQRLLEDYVPDDYRDRQSMPARTVPADNFFVLGDHRSSSNDSRAWGTVDRRYIYGKAVFVYWPLDKTGPGPLITLRLPYEIPFHRELIEGDWMHLDPVKADGVHSPPACRCPPPWVDSTPPRIFGP